eukprot:m.3010 g.3010  ORF g.3010 m.3010 type:complete len:457 (+) comp9006_c0_seq1:42-1412(+)
MLSTVAFVLIAYVAVIRCDTPANCTYEETQGSWVVQVGPGGHDNTLDCSEFVSQSTFTVDLHYPDSAVDEHGNKGFWTMIYNQGYELVINGRKYFAFADYGELNVDLCGKTKNGWSHNINGTDWACYKAAKKGNSMRNPKRNRQSYVSGDDEERMYRPSQAFVDEINAAQSSWKAALYPELSHYTLAEMRARSGGIPGRFPDTGSERGNVAFDETMDVPDELDWRDVNGMNYVSPVRNQGGCGSCFAFASMGMIEARERILTNNSVQNVYSPQDVVSCSEYSQGCEGGFVYLTAGKYAEDFGVVEESCNPYLGRDTPTCKTNQNCTRHYSTHYYYVGGYYGASNGQNMRLEVAKNGPLAVAFEVYGDFQHYKSGIYHHVESVKDRESLRFNPFQIVNHGVLIVGYGTDQASGQDYWIVKNSWGESWGEKGYFRIRRGNDECSIESCAVATTPIESK